MFAQPGFTAFDAYWIIWIGLLIALPVLVKRLRHPALAFGVPTLLAGVIYIVLSGPVAAIVESNFKARAGDTLALTGPLPADSIYIPERRTLETPLYDCFSNWPRWSCALPIGDWFANGTMQSVETGTGPYERLTLEIHAPDCHARDFSTFGEMVLSAGLGICPKVEQIDAPTAALQLEMTPKVMPFPSETRYWRLTLSDRTTGEALAIRDHWIVPYGARDDDPTLPEATNSPRQPQDTLADLIRLTFDGNPYDTAYDDRMLATHGLDFDVLLAAASEGPQRLRAEAMFLACRNGVVAFLSAAQRAELRAVSEDIFLNENWRYPESCAPNLR